MIFGARGPCVHSNCRYQYLEASSGPRISLRSHPSYSAILIAHIFAGTLRLLSGTAAMSFRKGSPRHVLAGKIFVASMLTMAVLNVRDLC